MYIRYEKINGKVLNLSSDPSYGSQEDTKDYAFAQPANSPDGFDLEPDKIYIVETDTIRNATQVELDQWNLDEIKNAKLSVIDNKTTDLISNGFVFDGNNFSLSLEAQSNWHVLWNGRESIVTYPKEVSTKDHEAYMITDSTAMNNFGMTAFGTVSAIIQSGRDLKVQVKAATTGSEVDLIVDTR